MPQGLARRLGWLTLFGAAFGFLEAAVVVYLRAIYYPDGFRFPLHVIYPPDTLAYTELAREAATLLMLLGVAGVAARSAWGRFGAFAFTFGVWDLVFYAGLKVVLDWPASLATWDVLFLLPGIWTGPVWSAAVIALCLVAGGAVILGQDAAGRPPRIRWFHWCGAVLSLLVLLLAFLWNHRTAVEGGVPEWFPWPVWLLGVALGLATFVHLSWIRSPTRRGSPRSSPPG
jgi:hypothetical protein